MSTTSFGVSPSLFDICINLDNVQFDSDREALLQRGRDVGVAHLCLTGSSLSSSRFALEWAKKDPSHYVSTTGIHPHDAVSATPEVLREIELLLQEEEVRAVGECGLDYNRNFSPREAQIRCFESQIDISNRHRYPLFLHQRDAHADFMGCMEEATQPAVVHCFTDSKESLFSYLDRGWYIGITGWICDPKRGEELRSIVNHIPLSQLMVETDAPWLFPKDYRPKPKKRRNEPKYLPHIVAVLATHMNQSVEDVVHHSFQNACTFFGIRS